MTLVKKTARAIKYNFFGTNTTLVLETLVMILVVKNLGVYKYGEYVFIQTIFLFLEPVINLQIERALIRYLPDYRDKSKDLVSAIIKFANRLKLASFFITSLIVYFFWSYFFSDTLVFFYIITLRNFFRIFWLNYSTVLQAFFEHKYKQSYSVLGSLIKLLIAFFFLPLYPNVETALLLTCINAFFLSTVYWFKSVRIIGNSSSELPDEIRKKILKMSPRALLSRYLTYIVWKKSEVFFLNIYKGPESVAYYGLGYELAQRFMQMIESPVGDLQNITGLEIFNKNPSKYPDFLERVNKFFCIVYIPLGFIAFFSSDMFIPILFGENMQNSSIVLKVMILVFFIPLCCSHCGAMIYALEKWNLMVIVQSTAAIINVSLGLYLIPRYGIDGALLASSLSIILIPLFFTIYFYRDFGNVVPFYSIIKAFFASLPCGVLAYAYQNNVPMFISVDGSIYSGILDLIILGIISLLGILIYLVLISKFKIFDYYDKELLSKINVPFLKKLINYI